MIQHRISLNPVSSPFKNVKRHDPPISPISHQNNSNKVEQQQQPNISTTTTTKITQNTTTYSPIKSSNKISATIILVDSDHFKSSSLSESQITSAKQQPRQSQSSITLDDLEDYSPDDSLDVSIEENSHDNNDCDTTLPIESHETDKLLNEIISDMSRATIKTIDGISEVNSKKKLGIRDQLENERLDYLKKHRILVESKMKELTSKEAKDMQSLFKEKHNRTESEYQKLAKETSNAIATYNAVIEKEKMRLRQIQEEQERIKREELERKKREEERLAEIEREKKRVEDERKKREEEERRKREEEEKRQREEQEKKMREEEERKKREEDEIKKKEEEEKRQKEENIKRETEEKKKRDEDEEKKNKEEKEKREAEEKRREEEEKNKQHVASQPIAMPLMENCEYIVSTTAYTEYLERLKLLNEMNKYLEDYKNQVPAHLQEHIKECNKTVNKIFNQISQSPSIIKEKSQDLIHLLSSNTTTPYLYKSIILLISKKAMTQVESQIVPHPSSAAAYSLVISNVCVKHPELLPIFIAQLNTECSYTVPMYAKKLNTDNNEMYYKKIGYKVKVDSGRLETEEEYNNRMCGYITLFAAFIQAPEAQNHFGIENGWKWIARVVNMKVRRTTSFLLVAFLQIAGSCLLQVYKQQFGKILMAMTSPDFFDKLPGEQCQPSKSRLQNILEKYVKTKTIDTLDGFEIK